MRRPTTFILLASLCVTGPAIADEPANSEESASAQICSLYEEVDKYQLLRRLSLDLRHQLPEYEEYLALANEEGVPDSLVEAYLASDEFASVVRRYHQKLLWLNLDSVQLAAPNFILREGPGAVRYLNSTPRSKAYRGGNNLHACQNKPQTDIQAGYQLGEAPQCENVDENGVTYCLEGYVEVQPYWEPDPSKTIKLCAFEAQTAATVSLGPAAGTSCNSPDVAANPFCGCGPNANYCWSDEPINAIGNDMVEQLMLTIDDHTIGGKPYSEIFTTKEIYSNERLAFFNKHLAQMSSPNRTYNTWHEGDAPLLDNPDYNDQTWFTTTRSGAHAGIQTMAAFTLRFQTNRGRANRFRIALANQHFEPSDSEDSEGCSDDTDNLTERCTCRYCHQTLEPLAAHFAPIAEAGSTLVTEFQIDRNDCLGEQGGGPKGPPDPWCDRFWITDQNADNAGRLITHQYYEEVPEIAAAIEAGPIGLAQTFIADGTLARGTVQHLFEHFHKRPMNLTVGSDDDENELLDELSQEFQTSDNFVQLVKRIVQLELYRRVR